MKFRVEHDSMGELKIPFDAYYGIHTLRVKDNLSITKQKVHRQMIKSMAIIKKASALANMDAGLLPLEYAKAIALACDDVLNGRFTAQFIVDAIQGGAGDSINMNINEVIANRANEILGGQRGDYSPIHPLEQVNLSQTANDIIPAAGKMTTIFLVKKLMVELKKLYKSFLDLANKYAKVSKMGRTHLQDAVPISVGQSFGAFASAINRDMKRLNEGLVEFEFISIGSSLPTGDKPATSIYTKKVVDRINEFSKMEFKQAHNVIDVTRNVDHFVYISSILNMLAIDLSKTANDLRLMASSPFGEITLPVVYPPFNKNNPIGPEVVNQVCFQVMGKNIIITKAAEAGQLELNAFVPLILANLFEEIDFLRRACRVLRETSIEGLIVNEEKCISYIENKNDIISILSNQIGFDVALSLADEALSSNMSIEDLVVEKGLLSKKELQKLIDKNKK